MSRTNNQTPPLSLEPQIDEDRVRRALGLKTNGTTHQQRPEQARQRHRFVADGAVPVVMINRADSETTGLKERIANLEHTLENERAAHAGTRRALSDAQAAFQALQTRFGHTELSNGEVLKSERNARRTAEETLAALRAERVVPRRITKSAAKAPIAEPDLEFGSSDLTGVEGPVPAPVAVAMPESVHAASAAEAPRPERKPRAPAIPKEPKPVRWWTPSFRAKKP